VFLRKEPFLKFLREEPFLKDTFLAMAEQTSTSDAGIQFGLVELASRD
jgi:hypothetical protein